MVGYAKYVGKFIPYPRQERVIRIPEIVYKIDEKIDENKKLSKQGKIRLNWISI